MISSPWWTGASEPVLQLSLGLSNLGHNVDFSCILGQELEKKAEEHGMNVIKEFVPTRKLNPFEIINFIFAFAKYLDDSKIDIIHTHLTADHWLATFSRMLAKNSPKIIRTIHNSRVSRSSILDNFLLGKSSDKLIAVNRYIKDFLHRKLEIPYNKIDVVQGAVDLDKFNPKKRIENREIGRKILGVDRETFVIGIVSRLAHDRGYHFLLEAYKKVSQDYENVKLVIIGKGEFLPNIENKVEQLALNQRVSFAGYHEEDLVEVLSALDLFTLMAPGSEGSCRAVLESMAMGLPNVVTNLKGLDEVVLNGENAYSVPYGNQKKLVESFEKMIVDENLRNSFGRKGRIHVEELFHREYQSEKIETIYRETISFG
jgi:glycosyltransferase involved in cell wall biosynthesis